MGPLEQTQSLIGWGVEWRSIFCDSFCNGVVIDETTEDVSVLDFDYDEVRKLNRQIWFDRKRPDLKHYVHVLYNMKLYNQSKDSTHVSKSIDFYSHIEQILNLITDKSRHNMLMAKRDIMDSLQCIESVNELFDVNDGLNGVGNNTDSVVAVDGNDDEIEDDKSIKEDDKEGDEESESENGKGEGEGNDEKSMNGDGSDGKNDDDDNDDGDDDESEGDDDSDDDSDYDDDDDDDSDASSETENESNDEADDVLPANDNVAIEFKVTIGGTNEVRGFSIPKPIAFTEVMRLLEADYGVKPRLFYHDDDGDYVNISAPTDFEYAVRSHQRYLRHLDKNKKKKKKPKSDTATGGTIRLKLKFTAEFASQFDQTLDTLNRENVNNRKLSNEKTYRSNSNGDNNAMIAESIPHNNTHDNLLKMTLNSQQDSLKSSHHSTSSTSEVFWQRGELLGSGSFGQVFSAIDLNTGTRIAVKEVKLGMGKRHEQQAMALQKEIKILAELNHPNIIRYLGTELSIKDQTMRIFLELATEGSIKDALNEFGKIHHNSYLFVPGI